MDGGWEGLFRVEILVLSFGVRACPYDIPVSKPRVVIAGTYPESCCSNALLNETEDGC